MSQPTQISVRCRRIRIAISDAAKITGEVAKRRRNLERVIHNFGLLVSELGSRDQQLKEFVDSSNAALSEPVTCVVELVERSWPLKLTPSSCPPRARVSRKRRALRLPGS